MCLNNVSFFLHSIEFPYGQTNGKPDSISKGITISLFHVVKLFFCLMPLKTIMTVKGQIEYL